MKKHNKIALQQIGQFINEIRTEHGISPQYIARRTGLNEKQITDILTGSGNYTMTDFLNVCHCIQVHFELSDLRERSNFDLLPDRERPSGN